MDNFTHCCGCKKLVNMDVGFGVACDGPGNALCAACIRKRKWSKTWDGFVSPERGERSQYRWCGCEDCSWRRQKKKVGLK